MGNENNFEVTRNEFDNNKTNLSNKAPEFYINKSYPIHGNKSLKDIIRNYIDGKVDSFEINNKNVIDEKNLLTPTFNTKKILKHSKFGICLKMTITIKIITKIKKNLKKIIMI